MIYNIGDTVICYGWWGSKLETMRTGYMTGFVTGRTALYYLVNTHFGAKKGQMDSHRMVLVETTGRW